MLLKFLLALALMLVLSCRESNASHWLIKTSNTEITVSAAGKLWDNLDQNTKASYLAEDSPVGSFVSALGRETIILHEIDNDTYLHSPVIENMTRCWVRSASVAAYSDSLSLSIQREITETDLLNYKNLLGAIVWYSSNSEAVGPVRLPDLPWDLAFAFDSMTTGDAVLIEGIAYTLDSTVTTPHRSMDENPISTARENTFAISNLTRSRTERNIQLLTAEALKTLTVDTAHVSTYCTRRNSVDDQTILASWNGGTITAEEFDGITAFIALGQPTYPNSSYWVNHNLRAQAGLIHMETVYSNLSPQGYASIQQRAEEFAVSQAGDLLYIDNITNTIVITDSMIIAAYSRMDSVPVLPETRVFESIAVPCSLGEEALAELNNDDSLYLSSHTGYSEFLLPEHNTLSRPVTRSELPLEISRVLFELDEIGQRWYGSSAIGEDMFIIYRLTEILPPHHLTFDELNKSLRLNTIIHCEEQRTMEWICELERRYNLQINNQILGDLPPDPSQWSSL